MKWEGDLIGQIGCEESDDVIVRLDCSFRLDKGEHWAYIPTCLSIQGRAVPDLTRRIGQLETGPLGDSPRPNSGAEQPRAEW